MATEIIMPKAGMDMEEGTVIKWLKQEGDKVETGEPILEILTDKVNMEVEAEVSGTLLKITAQEGDVLPVFTVIGYIGEAGETINISSKSKEAPAMGNVPQENNRPVPVEEKIMDKSMDENDMEGKVRATPAARKLARERSMNIAHISGTGPMGRIQKADVESYKAVKATPLAQKIAEVENMDLSGVKGTGIGGKITKEDLIANIQKEKTSSVVSETGRKSEEKDSKIIPMIGLRKIIADRMMDSLSKSAPVALNIEIDMTNASRFREKVKDIVLKETGSKITLTDVIIMAATKALTKFPIVNATLTDEGIRINPHINMGIAVGLDKGLLVPVIKGTDKMSLKEIVVNRTDIVKRTADNKVTPDELSGSTFTVSNMGMYDILSFNSIINQPNSAIMSVGTTVKKMRIIDDKPEIRSVMVVSVTIDHRIMDGLDGAKFLQYFKDLLEDPNLLLL